MLRSLRDHRLATLAVFIVAVWLALFLIRFLSPSDLTDDDQERPAAYVMDAVVNGNWIVQRDHTGDVCSKPPLYVWLAGLASLPFGQVSLFTLYFPCALATLGSAMLILIVGDRRFGRDVGFLGALVYLLSYPVIEQICLARTDPVFTFLVFSSMLVLYQVWTTGRGWAFFALLAAAATLTKGPLGPLLALGGLGALLWERRTGKPARIKAPGAWPLLLFFGVTLGWFFLAIWDLGLPVVDKMIRKELIGHAVQDEKGRLFLQGFFKPTLYFLSRYVPWSFLTFSGILRIWRRPSSDDRQRRFERFVACSFLFGLALFSVGAHQRSLHILPLLPAAALLAGRELALLIRPREPRGALVWVGVVSLAFIGVTAHYFFVARSEEKAIRRTVGLETFADRIRTEVGAGFPLTHVKSRYTIQFRLHTFRLLASRQAAEELLLRDEAAFVVLDNHARLDDGLEARLHTVASWPESGTPTVRLVGNHPTLEWTEKMAACFGDLEMRMYGLRLLRDSENLLEFESASPDSRLVLFNRSSDERRIRVRIRTPDGTLDERIVLEPTETETIRTNSLVRR